MLSIIAQPAPSRIRHRKVTAGTGSHCPISGIWAPEGEASESLQVLEGSIMPAHQNSAVRWQLLQGITRHDLRS